jgi:hypothetical protein
MLLESIFFGVPVTMHDNRTENYISTKAEKNKYKLDLDVENRFVYITKEGFDYPIVVPVENVRRFIPVIEKKVVKAKA